MIGALGAAAVRRMGQRANAKPTETEHVVGAQLYREQGG